MVFLYTHTLMHYRVPVYNRLSEACAKRLIVVFGQQAPGAGHLSDGLRACNFEFMQVKNHWFGGDKAVWHPFLKPFKVFGKPEAVIVQHNPRIVTLVPFILYCSVRGVPHILWGHGGSRRRDVGGHTVKDLIHRSLIKRCDAYICYTDTVKERLTSITSAEKLFVATNTLDTDSLIAFRKKLEREGRQNVRRRLGLSRQHYICFIGRLIADKKAHMVLDILKLLQQDRADIGAVIIGDGPEMGVLRKKTSQYRLSNVHFTGAISDWAHSASYLFACDVLLNPGDVGLCVNHALILGLPVITQEPDAEGPFHGPEAAFIKPGKTGYFVRRDNLHLMAACVHDILADRPRWYDETIDYAQRELSMHKMVDGIVAAINSVSK